MSEDRERTGVFSAANLADDRPAQTATVNLTLDEASVILSSLALSMADRTRAAPKIEALERVAYAKIRTVEQNLYQKQQQEQRQEPSSTPEDKLVQRIKRGLRL